MTAIEVQNMYASLGGIRSVQIAEPEKHKFRGALITFDNITSCFDTQIRRDSECFMKPWDRNYPEAGNDILFEQMEADKRVYDSETEDHMTCDTESSVYSISDIGDRDVDIAELGM